MELREQALHLLARREHSTLELKRKLLAKGHPSAQVETLLAQLAAEGLQDDARYVECYVRSRMNAGYGAKRIRLELNERGIQGDLLEQYLLEDEDIWTAQLREVWNKKYAGQLPKNQKEYMRQLRFLMQRGFESSMIHRLLNGRE